MWEWCWKWCIDNVDISVVGISYVDISYFLCTIEFGVLKITCIVEFLNKNILHKYGVKDVEKVWGAIVVFIMLMDALKILAMLIS